MAENWGLKISLPGYDVSTALPHQCSVHSGYPVLKTWNNTIYGWGNGRMNIGTVELGFNANPPADVPTVIWSIPHLYGGAYTPACLVRGKYATTGYGTFQSALPIEPTGTMKISAQTTPTHLQIVMNRGAGWGSVIGDTLTFSYIVFAENGA